MAQFTLSAAEAEALRYAAASRIEELARDAGASRAMGRSFSPGEELPGAAPVTIVSTEFWRTQLGAYTNSIGRTIELDERIRNVVRVMGPEFRFPPQVHTNT